MTSQFYLNSKQMYFNLYESPNIVIVPNENLSEKNKIPNTAAVAEKTVAENTIEIENKDPKPPAISSGNLELNQLNTDQNVIINIDKVEEALKQLHNVQNVSAEISSIQRSKLDNLSSTNSKVIKCNELKINEEHGQDDRKLNEIGQFLFKDHRQNNARIKSSNNIVTMSSTTESNGKDTKLAHTYQQKKVSQNNVKQTETKSNHKSGYSRKRKQDDCNDNNAKKICLEQSKLLNVKTKTHNNKINPGEIKFISNHHNLKINSKNENDEHESREPNNELLKEGVLSHKQKHNRASGSLKRYLDYQRFLGNCFKNSPNNSKNEEKPSVDETYPRNKSTSNYSKKMKDKQESINITTIVERNKDSEKLTVKSTIERVKKKEKSINKLNSNLNEKVSSRQSTSSNDRKKKKEDCNKKSLIAKCVKKKEETKNKHHLDDIKQEKLKRKHVTNYEKDVTKIFGNCSDEKDKLRSKKCGTKHKLGNAESNKKSSGNSQRNKVKEERHERKKVKEESHERKNRLKRKSSDFEREEKLKCRQYESNSVMTSQSEKDTQKTPTLKRYVNIIKKTSCHNLPTSCDSKIDLRANLTRKNTKNQCTSDFVQVHAPTVRENLLVTLKQDLPAKPSVRTQTTSKFKVKKSKDIALVVNFSCPSSNESDAVSKKNEHECTNEIPSPLHQDLSFLDDFDIDGIVDSLNADQNPSYESNISAQDLSNSKTYYNKSNTGLEILNKICQIKTLQHLSNHSPANKTDVHVQDLPATCDNKANTGLRTLEKDCQITTLHPDLQPKSQESNNRVVPKTGHPHDNPQKNNVVKNKYNDDVYEVIDITDDGVNSFILIEDDISSECVDPKQNANQVIVRQTESIIRSIEGTSTKTVNKVPVIYINDDSTCDINTSDVSVTDTNVTEVKYSTKRAFEDFTLIEDTVDATQEISNIEISNAINNNKTQKGRINIKTEHIGEIPIVSLESVSKDVDKLHLIKETHDHHLPINIKKELDTNTHFSTLIKKEVEDTDLNPLTLIKKEVGVTDLNLSKYIKKEAEDTDLNPSKYIKKEVGDKHSSPQTNIKKEVKDMHLLRSTNIKTEITTSNIKKEEYDLCGKAFPTNIKRKASDDDGTVHVNKIVKSEKLPISTQNTEIVSNGQSRDNNTDVNEISTEITDLVNEINTKVIKSENASASVQSNVKSKDNEMNYVHKLSTQNAKTIKSETVTFSSQSNIESAVTDTSLINEVIMHNFDIINCSNVSIPLESSVKCEDNNINSRNVCIPALSNVEPKGKDINLVSKMNVRNTKVIKSEKQSCSMSTYGNLSEHSAITTAAGTTCKTAVTEKIRYKIPKHVSKQADTPLKTRTPLDDSLVKIDVGTKNIAFKTKPIPTINKLYTSYNKKKPVLKFVKKQSVAKVPHEIENNSKLRESYTKIIEIKTLKYLHNKITLLNFIHCGYFSNIYKCTDSNGMLYAIKFLKKKFVSLGIYKDRMLRNLKHTTNKGEYFNLEMLSNFHINGELCLLTEYYPKTLEKLLDEKKPLDIGVVQSFSKQLVAAVDTLTRNNIIHSDVKPSHILVDSTNKRLKLCGFDRSDYNYKIKIIPSSGTVNYRAPEIILGYHADYKIDVWATALVMYEMASGTKLFPGLYNNDILYKQICTLGPIHKDLCTEGGQAFTHFSDKGFLLQVGPQKWICLDKMPEKNDKLRTGTYAGVWKTVRNTAQVSEDVIKMEKLHKLLEQMLVIHPRHRLPIALVATSEFF